MDEHDSHALGHRFCLLEGRHDRRSTRLQPTPPKVTNVS